MCCHPGHCHAHCTGGGHHTGDILWISIGVITPTPASGETGDSTEQKAKGKLSSQCFIYPLIVVEMEAPLPTESIRQVLSTAHQVQVRARRTPCRG